METRLKEKVYEVEFESLNIKEVEKFENNKAVLNAKVDVSVTIGSYRGTIKDVLDLKEGDIIYLNKTVDEDLDININGKNIALGESLKVDDKMSVRILDFKK
ncbi:MULTISPECIES: FliM/FliN family flagellar motor switch protein [Clostridium]|uniref:FliM/FliN family flagellar motor switch protein n=1 Tax=Clostridium TaxID=1485 RepID=UPI00040D2146|nr:FliM/FliN family flagellar motor C-terminal domain-containing protein [Clostridium cadaveris]MDU4950809.1 FliM/FliN family flagellar motor C-terminal domain-containing protein [Clostridium sp.]NME63723.1 FliM/FliN family flagellar motor switch protein [Clostridium cadaveris]